MMLSMKSSSKKYLLIIFLSVFFIIFCNFSFLLKGKGSNILILLMVIGLIIFIPVVAIFFACSPNEEAALVAAGHMGIFIALIIIIMISNIGDGFLMFLSFLLLIELAILGIGFGKAPGTFSVFVHVCIGVSGAIVAGWLSGVLLFSEMMPSRIITAAEEMAKGQPYCMYTNGKKVKNSGDLTALNMLPKHYGEFADDFHALMIIGSDTDKTYANWSYRQNAFVQVRERSRQALHLDRYYSQCETELAYLSRFKGYASMTQRQNVLVAIFIFMLIGLLFYKRLKFLEG